ncbi:unnamed protein product [Macrosiphum euphorbiae]|uniref:Uncharacterized protein n=1 Tax=Macrosiphum euphorbiae TaxID=13131 RepID=A0AAV0XBI2_9HEMI|nr:unnamed protein product [Macrosiphum euphorbiae]
MISVRPGQHSNRVPVNIGNKMLVTRRRYHARHGLRRVRPMSHSAATIRRVAAPSSPVVLRVTPCRACASVFAGVNAHRMNSEERVSRDGFPR